MNTVPASGTEVSAGAALLRGSASDTEFLVIKVRASGYELPKGHLELDETPEKAAARELKEETGLVSTLEAGELLGTLVYTFEKDGATIQKQVHYFLFAAMQPLVFGKRPSRTKEVRWIKEAEVADLPLVNEELRPIILKAFAACLAGRAQSSR